MNYEELKIEWLKEEQHAFQGWDFSHLKGRRFDEPLPWNYDKIVRQYLRPEHIILDMGTGGGEYLLSLKHSYANTYVTEAYLPNVNLCMNKLAPLGITVKQVLSDNEMPYEDGVFNIILNRHEAFSAEEVYRLLKPGGYFITQQVGGENNVEISKFLIDDFVPQYPKHNLSNNKAILMSAGLEILEEAEYFPFIRFADIGALVFLAKIIEWEFPNFSVERCFDKLITLNETVIEQGYLESKGHNFLIICQKPIHTSFTVTKMELELKRKGADIVRFVDLSSLSDKENRGFGKAILIGVLLSKEYIINLRTATQTVSNEFAEKEHRTDELAEWTAEYLQKHGYNAFAQSEENNWQSGFFDTKTKSSTLPHKTIAVLAGLGWIGKNNLLITQDYGCAFCMCSILTDAPIDFIMPPLINSKCGECNICKQVCPTNAISGNVWLKSTNRNTLIDVFRCECCLKCLSHCQWTVSYAKQGIE